MTRLLFAVTIVTLVLNPFQTLAEEVETSRQSSPVPVLALGVGVVAFLFAIHGRFEEGDSPHLIWVRLEMPDESDPWYVGEKRTGKIRFKVDFGHIRGEELGTLSWYLYWNNDPTRPIGDGKKWVTFEGDGDPETETLNGTVATYDWDIELEGIRVGTSKLMARVSVTGMKDGFIDSHDVWGPFDEEVAEITVDYPFRTDFYSDKIGILDPPQETANHNECFTQRLQIHNFSPAAGAVTRAKIMNTTRYDAPLNASGLTTIVEGDVTHEDGLIGHTGQESYRTDWSLYRDDNIYLKLERNKEWRTDGDQGIGGLDNLCDPVPSGTCPLPDIIYGSSAMPINETYQLSIVSSSQPTQPAANRDVIVTSPTGGQTVTTDALGNFSINVPSLGPLVDMQLVVGPDSALFERKTFVDFPVGLLDGDPPPWHSFTISYKEAQRISGRVIDNHGDGLVADIYAINPADPGVEVLLTTADSAYVIQPVDLVTLGYPATTLRFRVRPGFNRAYATDFIDVPHATNGTVPVALSDVVFVEAPNYDGTVLFTGNAISIGLAHNDEPIRGLRISVAGAGVVTTDANGDFQLSVPGPSMMRRVALTNVDDLVTARGELLVSPPQPSVDIEFGKGGPVMDVGTVVLKTKKPSPHAKIRPKELGSERTRESSARNALHAAWPNPFNPSTRIYYEVAAPSPVRLTVFDIRGRVVRILVDEPGHSAGAGSATWDGRDQFGVRVASGIYFYRLTAGSFEETRKVVLVK